MINNIQELINWAEESSSKALYEFEKRKIAGAIVNANVYFGRSWAFEELRMKLTLLLNSERENGGEINGQTAENCGNAHVVGSMPKSADSSG